MPDLAQQALDSAKSAHRRIDNLEVDVKNIQSLTAALARMDAKVDDLDSDVKEIKADVKAITARPASNWEALIRAIILAAASGLVGAALAALLR